MAQWGHCQPFTPNTQRKSSDQPRAGGAPRPRAVLQVLVESGRFSSIRAIGKHQGLSGARVSQLLNLLDLPPDIMTAIDMLPEDAQPVNERELRTAARMPEEKQVREWKRLLKRQTLELWCDRDHPRAALDRRVHARGHRRRRSEAGMIALAVLGSAAWAAVIELAVVDDAALEVPLASVEVWSKAGQLLDSGTGDGAGRWTSRELPGGDVEIRTTFLGFTPSRLRTVLPPDAGAISSATIELSFGFGEEYRREDYWYAWKEEAFPPGHDGVRVWVTDGATGNSVMARFVSTGHGAEAVVETGTAWPRRRPTLFQIPESDWAPLLAMARWGTLRPLGRAAVACEGALKIRAEWRQGADYHELNQEICASEAGPTADLVQSAMRVVGRAPDGAVETP